MWGEFSSPPQIFELLGTSTAWEVVFSQGDDDDDGGIMTYDYYCLALCHILCYTLPHLINEPCAKGHYPHFTDEETEVPVTGLKPYSNQ